MPSGYAIALLPDVADRQSRDGRPQRVVCRKHSVIAMPAPTRGRGDGSVAWFEQSSFSISASRAASQISARKILVTAATALGRSPRAANHSAVSEQSRTETDSRLPAQPSTRPASVASTRLLRRSPGRLGLCSGNGNTAPRPARARTVATAARFNSSNAFTSVPSAVPMLLTERAASHSCSVEGDFCRLGGATVGRKTHSTS